MLRYLDGDSHVSGYQRELDKSQIPQLTPPEI